MRRQRQEAFNRPVTLERWATGNLAAHSRSGIIDRVGPNFLGPKSGGRGRWSRSKNELVPLVTSTTCKGTLRGMPEHTPV